MKHIVCFLSSIPFLWGVAEANDAINSSYVQTTVTIAGGTQRPLSDRLSDYVSIKDFGAKGDVVSKNVVENIKDGSSEIILDSIDNLKIGIIIHGAGADGKYFPDGTVINSINGNKVVLSANSINKIPVGTVLDFGGADDSVAISNAVEYACKNDLYVLYPSGRYYAPNVNYSCSGLYFKLDHASLSSASSGIPSNPDQSQIFSLSGSSIIGNLNSPQTQNVSYMSGVFSGTGSLNSYQHNIQSIVGRNNDPYNSYLNTDGKSVLATHDAVGQFISMSQPSTNTFGNTWVWNHVLGLDEGSNGSAVIGEAQILNNRTTNGSDFDGVNTVGGYDEIYNCTSQCLYAHFFQGSPNNKPGLTNGLVFRRGAVANIDIGQLAAAYVQPDGSTLASSHATDWAIYSSGLGFFQSLHVGGGNSIGDVMSNNGLNVTGDGTLNADNSNINKLNSQYSTVSRSLSLASNDKNITPVLDFINNNDGDSSSIMRIISTEPGKLKFLSNGSELLSIQNNGIYSSENITMNNNTISGAKLILSAVDHLHLPSGSISAGLQVWCTDCYSRAPLQFNYNVPGIPVVWNGLNWTDLEGYLYGLTPNPLYLQLQSMSKAQILSIKGMSEGSMIQDNDDHAPVIYENGSWHLIQLGDVIK
ncbi:hypothetical protein [Neokomagataea anthophila]|uniref:Pectate lyase superfamily protein domain-containing protein n=1 Tax=Neokomagataea anthophila TaxID=2826925 RepID=A0ABS5E9D0_9PROT|nr:hypothetical protein [Neokomagataea anthophila]MBR0560516.1 hypothetical protein [Neokomagataea anthophila]